MVTMVTIWIHPKEFRAEVNAALLLERIVLIGFSRKPKNERNFPSIDIQQAARGDSPFFSIIVENYYSTRGSLAKARIGPPEKNEKWALLWTSSHAKAAFWGSMAIKVRN